MWPASQKTNLALNTGFPTGHIDRQSSKPGTLTLLHVLRVLLTTRVMNRKKRDSVKAMGFEDLESSATARIVISKRAKKEFDGFETKQRARLTAVLKRWCASQSLTEEMMNPSEGRTSKHKEMVQAFKAFKVRLYGFERTIDTVRTFFIVDADPAKKQNRAGPVLDRAKRRVDASIDQLID